MFKVNLSKIRPTRQLKTNRNLAEVICHTESFVDKDLKPFINFKSLDRLAELIGVSRTYLYQKSRDDYEFALALAHGCAIAAARQGAKDEYFVLNEINNFTKSFGVYVQPLGNKDLRPVKDGRILNAKEFENSKLSKLDCLKSIDAVINGKYNGYVFAKIVFGSGGAQDNVFQEAAQFADWAHEFGEEDKIYVLLIDTDLQDKYNELKDRYNRGNVWVCDHVDFQTRLEN